MEDSYYELNDTCVLRLTGLLVTPAPYTSVYLGLWGYNALLTCGGISFFTVPSLHSLVACVAGSLIAVASQAACTPVFDQVILKTIYICYHFAE